MPTFELQPVYAPMRPRVNGKFLSVGGEKLYLRGVTYGPFRPDAHGSEYGEPARVARDFAQMTAHGINTIRVYTVPPRWLLDAAFEHGLRVLVGLPWEQHTAFLQSRRSARAVEARVRAGVSACAGHPAVLAYVIGNEIPAPIVRWHGPHRVERFLERLYRVAKAADPEGLVTYANYPSTEYLDLPFTDFVCFNVYLEQPERLEAYLAHLHTVAGDRPLIISELGLDSLRHGETAQARTLTWQLRTTFAQGCGGAYVFAWTDEWHRGGHDIDDWKFGLTDTARRPKPALFAVRDAYAEVPFAHDTPWPSISVVVCAYNGAATLRRCLDGVRQLDYPCFEVIVVDDGSTDGTAAIAEAYGFRVVRTANRGLSSARNTGLAEASGDIVAYLDSDAWPDPHWLKYLAAAFLNSSHCAVGGPNLPPPDDSPVAECVARAPGGPTHVLSSDSEAEHIPGCNMAIRRDCLAAVGGFDPQFRVAGDDVDLCWRLQQQGWTLGFSPAAVVWHQRRDSVQAYWRQQVGYGRAEALLEQKWPEKYNAAGHVTWNSRMYRSHLSYGIGWGRRRIFYGIWGSALFQSIYQPAPAGPWSLLLMPEWYLVILGLGALSALGLAWQPLLWALPLFVLAVLALLGQVAASTRQVTFPSRVESFIAELKRRSLTAGLYLLQPLARLWGRLACGLTLWRRRGPPCVTLPRPWWGSVWCEHWKAPTDRLQALEAAVKEDGALVQRGGAFDRWDLEVRAGTFGGVRLRMAIEEHGAGRQYVRVHGWPTAAAIPFALTLLLAGLCVGAAAGEAWLAAFALGLAAIGLALRIFLDWGTAMAAVLHALRALERENEHRHQVVPAVLSSPLPALRPAPRGSARPGHNGNGNGKVLAHTQAAAPERGVPGH